MTPLLGFAIGYVLAIPPGPLGLAAIRYGAQHHRGAVLALAAGAGLLDVFYCMFAMWASDGLLTAVMPSTQQEAAGSALLVTQSIIAAAMVIGGLIVIKTNDPSLRTQQRDELPQWMRRLRLRASVIPFLVGIGFALTNIANPTFMPSLVVMSGSIQGAGMLSSSSADVLSFCLGFGLGNALWLVTLGLLVQRFRERISGRILSRVRLFMGALLIGVGIVYIVRIVAST